jgi:hypothetical protein
METEIEIVDAAMVERRDRVIRGWLAVIGVGSVDELQRRSKTEAGAAKRRRQERIGNYREEKGGSASKAKRRNNTARLVMVHTFVVAFPFPFPLFVGVWRSAHSWTPKGRTLESASAHGYNSK